MIEPKDIRKRMEQVDISAAKVCQITGINRVWFFRMISKTKKYNFNEPNPEWMQHIMNFLDAYAAFKQEWKYKN